MVEVAVFGYGNIGSGVVQVIEENNEQIARKIPGGLHVKYILDIRDFPDSPYKDRIVHDIDVILSDPEVKVVCETMGGKEPAFTFSKKALEKGISVCSSNKELVEAFGPVLLKTAREHHCSYLFEASVGGGIPLIAPITECLTQERILSITGILNGTTNYILTKMERFGAGYEEVLKEAQELGYAEKNPQADVEGHDTGRKIAILSSLMTGRSVRYEDTHVEGITAITQKDFAFARANGCAIKLLGLCRLEEEGLRVMTAPFLIPEGHPLHTVNDVFNAVMVHGNQVDDLMLYGRGAGKLPTGSAVVADMIRAAACSDTIPILWEEEVLSPIPQGRCETAFFVRVNQSACAVAQETFAGLIQRIWDGDVEDTFAFSTEKMPEKAFFEKFRALGGEAFCIRLL